MAKITRLGLYGGPRPLYSTFAGKEASVPEQIITPTSIPSEEAFGTPTITVGTVTISPTSIPSEESFGTPVVVPVISISPTSIPSEESVGNPTITQGAALIQPTSIPSAESFGTPTIIGGAIIEDKVQFGKKFYANGPDKARDARRKALSLQMRQEDEEILAIVQIIGKILL